MKTRLWFFIHLQRLLIGRFVDSSSLSSAPGSLSVVFSVGDQAVLPCSWKSRLANVAPPACHIQWATPIDTVFEQRGEDRWEAVEFEGRVEVPEEKLDSGDCSLIIRDVQIGDTGRYESFMVVEEARSKRTRVFIQSVKLSVFDHKSLESRRPGEDLVLKLHTGRSITVVFQSRNSSEWAVVWSRETGNTSRVEKHLLLEQLTIKKLTRGDEGMYKVLDERGLAISTVQLSVDENATAPRVHQRPGNIPTDVASKSSGSALVIFSVLVTIVHMSLVP